MMPHHFFTTVVLLITLMPEGSITQNGLHFPKESDQPCNESRYLAKVHLKQTGYAQSIQYAASASDLSNGFTTHFWLNLDNLSRNATVLSYALSLQQLDTIIFKYAGGDTMVPFWELTLNGTVVFKETVRPLVQGVWCHITATWDAYTNTWALYQDGKCVAKGTALQIVNHVKSGGVVAIGADQRTLVKGMDQGEGVEGWITHFYMHSKPIQLKEYCQKVWPSRCSVDMPVFNDVIDWVQTPRKLVGGVTEVKANSSCGFF